MGRPKDKPLPLNELFDYNPSTGDIVWKVSRSRYRAGDIAGHIDIGGYVIIGVNKRHERAHAIAWEIYYGEKPDPRKEIDHINHNKSDNRISNLRLVTRSENQRNQSRNTRNKSGVTNVYTCKATGRWKVYITNPKTKKPFTKHCRNFTDAVMLAYCKRMEFGYHPNHGT